MVALRRLDLPPEAAGRGAREALAKVGADPELAPLLAQQRAEVRRNVT